MQQNREECIHEENRENERLQYVLHDVILALRLPKRRRGGGQERTNQRICHVYRGGTNGDVGEEVHSRIINTFVYSKRACLGFCCI